MLSYHIIIDHEDGHCEHIIVTLIDLLRNYVKADTLKESTIIYFNEEDKIIEDIL